MVDDSRGFWLAAPDALPRENEIQIPDGLARATIWLPIRDALPLPETRGLLLGDEIPELAGQPIYVEGDNGEVVAIADSEGHAPVEVRIWRIEETAPVADGFAAARACVASGLVHQEWNLPDELETKAEITVVVQVTFLIRKVGMHHFQGAILDQGIEFVRRLQTAYNMIVGGPPAELLAQEQLPIIVPVVISPGPPEPLRPGNLMNFAPLPMNSSVERFDRSHLTPKELLNEEETRKVMLMAGSLPAQPALSVQQFRTDARIQLHRYGNYRQSIIAAAACAESFLFTTYEMFLWEEGKTPAEAAHVLSQVDSILRRTKREMQTRLRGSWDENQPGPLAEWNTSILKVRNAIIHTGHAATRGEALKALESLNGLMTMFADRFSVRAIQDKYPKTAVLAVPKNSYERRGAWSDKLQLLSDNNYAEWWAGFVNWQRQMESLLVI